MANVSLAIAQNTLPCRSIEGTERLGEGTDLLVELVSPEPVERGAWVGQPCAVVLEAGAAPSVVSRPFAALRSAGATTGPLTPVILFVITASTGTRW